MNANEAHTNVARPERNEWKVLLVLALSFLLMEGLVRCFAGSLSEDLRNTLATPKTAARIARATDEVRTVLVVGNSLARRGVDLELLNQETGWPKDGKKFGVEAEQFTPDATSAVQWDWGIKRYFANTGSHPDVILIITGRAHLLDFPASPETLGAYFVGAPDLGVALKSMDSSEEALKLLLGRTSHVLANRDRVRTRIGYSYLPGFEIAWPKLTAVNDASAEAPDRQPQTANTESLKRLIATATEMGSDLHVFSVPMPKPYQLPENVIRLLENSKIPFHNLSSLPGIDTDHFPDNYHLDKSGARTFTRALLHALQRHAIPSQTIPTGQPDPLHKETPILRQ
jgi:hypothetical protein